MRRASLRGLSVLFHPATDEWVGFVFKSMELPGQRPGLLDEFELSFDIGVQAYEKQTGFRCRIISAALRVVAAADTQNAMTVRYGDFVG